MREPKDGLILYHGSYCEVKEPDLTKCSKAKDFCPLRIKGIALGYVHYSNATITNQFCLEIICCRVRFSFNYLIYPYYPAYMG